MTTPRAVALDLGSVLVDVHKARLPELLARDADEVADAFFGGDRHAALNRGELDVGDYLRDVSARLALAPGAVEEAWRAFVVPRPGARDLVERIALPVAAWSNIDAAHADALIPQLPARLFERPTLSYAIRAAKPAPAFYRHGIEQLGVAPAEVVFVDDLQANVDAARACGVRAFRADTLDALTDVLAFAGVLKEPA